MRCYYEELGVARDANDADIKSAYRKLALRWHPDKNLDCLEEAKAQFQLIQQAYEVLSDSHERCWYDNHREQILRGKNSNYEENSLDVFEYFSVSCFKGYGDDEKGFYSVYRQVFAKIATEDAEFMEDEEAVRQIPNFGDSQSNYEEVVGPFYAYWQAYCTKKTYAWLCPYDIQEIKDRRVLREIEKEMKKIVQKARKERNEEVRNLVSFVRKRDKRVRAYRQRLEQRAEQNRQKHKQSQLEQIRRRQEELKRLQIHEQHHSNTEYEEQLKQLMQDYGGDSSAEECEDADEVEECSGETSEEDFTVENLYCVACNKTFKNEKAYANHESSKKHREIVERMKQAMLDEEQSFQDLVEEDKDVSQSDGRKEGSNENGPETHSNTSEADIEGVDGSEDKSEEEIFIKKNSNKKHKKSRKNNKQEPPSEIIQEGEFLTQASTDSDVDNWNHKKKSGARKNKKSSKKPVETKKSMAVDELVKSLTNDVEMPAMKIDSENAGKKEPADVTPTTHVCVTCQAGFPSKNKLFNHLKLTNHGVYIAKPKATENKKSNNAKGRRK